MTCLIISHIQSFLSLFHFFVCVVIITHWKTLPLPRVCVCVCVRKRERDLATLYLAAVPLSPVPDHHKSTRKWCVCVLILNFGVWKKRKCPQRNTSAQLKRSTGGFTVHVYCQAIHRKICHRVQLLPDTMPFRSRKRFTLIIQYSSKWRSMKGWNHRHIIITEANMLRDSSCSNKFNWA